MGDGHEWPNYMLFPKDIDSFNDMVHSLHGKGFNNDDLQYNSPRFQFPQGFNMCNATEEKTGKPENAMVFEDPAELFATCPLKSFMDTQNLFREALRKASFFSHGGNSTGIRKDSIDFFKM